MRGRPLVTVTLASLGLAISQLHAQREAQPASWIAEP